MPDESSVSMSRPTIPICAVYRIICSSGECLMRVYENSGKWLAETECDSGGRSSEPFEGETFTEAYWKGINWIEENVGEFVEVVAAPAMQR